MVDKWENLSLEERQYSLNLPYHLSKATMIDELCELLTEFDFLDFKVTFTECQELIED